MSCGLLLARLLPQRLGVREPQKWRNTWYKSKGGMGGHRISHHGQFIGTKLHAGQQHSKICEDLGVSRSLVFKIKKLLDDGQDLLSWPRDGNKQTVWANAAIATVQVAVAENPQQNKRQQARHYKMDPRTVRNLVREDLGIES